MTINTTCKHRAAADKYGRDVQSCCCHQHTRNGLVTVRDHNKAVKLMCHRHCLNGVCDQISGYQRIFHTDMAHCDTIAYSDRRELNRHSACFCHTKLCSLCQFVQIHMTRNDLIVSVYDTDHRFLHFFSGKAECIKQ